MSSKLAAASSTTKEKKSRGKRERRAGLHFSVARCKRRIKRRWPGKVSEEAPVALAAFLQYVHSELLREADETRTRPSQMINASRVQAGLERLAWLRQSGLARGQVAGAALAVPAKKLARETDHGSEE